jgi:hypothetical protein
MKRGPFPHRRLCCPQRLKQYYGPLRLPLVCIAVSRVRRLSASIASRRTAATGTRRVSPVPRTTIRAFNAQYAGGFLGARFRIPDAFHGLRRRVNGSAPSIPPTRNGSLDDACSGFTHVADRTVASTPLRTRPLDHARGHRYRGPGHLPEPDSHRQAILNLSLGLRHDELPLIKRPSSLGAPRGCDTRPRSRSTRR